MGNSTSSLDAHTHIQRESTGENPERLSLDELGGEIRLFFMLFF